jgi:hypothetical protein
MLDEEAEKILQEGKAQKAWKELEETLKEKIAWLLSLFFSSTWESASLPEVSIPHSVHHFSAHPSQSKTFVTPRLCRCGGGELHGISLRTTFATVFFMQELPLAWSS